MERKLSDIPRLYRRLYTRAMSGRSRVSAIKCQCLECVGWVRDEVVRCTGAGCPLYCYRPYVKRGVSVASVPKKRQVALTGREIVVNR